LSYEQSVDGATGVPARRRSVAALISARHFLGTAIRKTNRNKNFDRKTQTGGDARLSINPMAQNSALDAPG
jgi:hypothetical protein